MSKTPYHQLRTDDEHSSEEDDSPPLVTHSIRDTIAGRCNCLFSLTFRDI